MTLELVHLLGGNEEIKLTTYQWPWLQQNRPYTCWTLVQFTLDTVGNKSFKLEQELLSLSVNDTWPFLRTSFRKQKRRGKLPRKPTKCLGQQLGTNRKLWGPVANIQQLRPNFAVQLKIVWHEKIFQAHPIKTPMMDQTNTTLDNPKPG